jgi:hypothetical protein
MSANGMVRPCSCPAAIEAGQGAPETRSTPCLERSTLQNKGELHFCSASIDGGKESLWVIHVISSEHKRRPLHTQLQTFRCVALTDAVGQSATSSASMRMRKEGLVLCCLDARGRDVALRRSEQRGHVAAEQGDVAGGGGEMGQFRRFRNVHAGMISYSDYRHCGGRMRHFTK